MSPVVGPLVLATPRRIVGDLTEVEIYSVASIKLRTGQATANEVASAIERFRDDLAVGHYRRVKLRAKHFRYARDRIARFDAPLRTLDALHLATAALAGAELMTLDRAPAKSAEAAGIEVVVPGLTAETR